MSDERLHSAWDYCTHPVFWYQGYWCCLDEQCEYRYVPVPTDPSWTYDPTGHDGDGLAAEPGADGESSLGDGTSGYGGATAYDEWRDDHQASSQQDQDAYQCYVQQYDGYQQDGYQHGGYQYGGYQHGGYQNGGYQNGDYQQDQQDDYRYNNQDGGQHSGYQEGVGQDDYGYPPNAEQPVPPSDVATMGSGSSAAQTDSPSSTETPDNEDASMVGNADEDTEDRTWPYVQEDNRDGQDVDEAMNVFPDCPVVDTRYPRKLSFGTESESGVDQSNIEERPDLGPR
ncbi:uncharacterized protein NECHADRAFT_76652 [Fusarium vanettenii 77-13-4]|uniref:Uncharacterized protein n=1 Tax=Fusarium vanettenii (strain ATCC MYA-4622 / CBS 123669 / FGSC 9596 / NRRL 45880 / 77-13-4) TaxID=660122 RepID=C7Z4V7_FUSV7|nr:uncharacterized protein NECHADRAFT_76652 [Fusarium vanettenii 77-13-4]EEU40989.1 predicted protein [Fusarium vanettenii 77-13-4]